jgi:serine O-acetyltransferase
MAGWQTTRRAIAADRQALAVYFATFEAARDPPAWPRPGLVAVVLYRLARYLHVNGWRLPARLLWLANIWLTGADIDSASSIGAGLAIPYPRTVTIYGTVGETCTFLGQSGIGGTLRERRGLPVLGDDVLVQPGAIVIGPVTIGRGARIGPRCIVNKDVPAYGEVAAMDWDVAAAAGAWR